MNINKVMVSGNLVDNAELRQTSSETVVLKFDIAVNDSKKNPQTGEWETVPSFFECVKFGKDFTKLSQIMVKGLKVALDGKLHQSRWEKDGKNCSKVEIIVDSIELLSTKSSNNDQQSTPPAQTPASDYVDNSDYAPYDIQF